MKRSRLLRAIPLLVVLGAGAWLWKGGGGFFPSTREIIWQLGDAYADIRAVDIQISDAKGALLRREQIFFPHGPKTPAVVEKAPLARGDFPARVFVKRMGRKDEQSVRTTLHVGSEDTIVMWLDLR